MSKGLFITTLVFGVFILLLLSLLPSTQARQVSVFPKAVPPTVLGTPWINLEDTQSMTVRFVTNTENDGPGSLRQAVADAESAGGNCWIKFQLSRSDRNYDPFLGVWTFPLQKRIFLQKDRIFIDGLSQRDFGGDTNPKGPEILIDGRGIPGIGDFGIFAGILHVYKVNQCWIRGLCVLSNTPEGNSSGLGVSADAQQIPAFGNRLSDNYLGINPDGESLPANTSSGFFVTKGAQKTLVENNVVCSEGFGVYIFVNFDAPNIILAQTTGNVVRGNKFGTNAAGTKRLVRRGYEVPGGTPNLPVNFYFPEVMDNIIENNIIAGNASGGIGNAESTNRVGAPNGSFNIIRNNRIGVGANGENIGPIGSPNDVLTGTVDRTNDQGSLAVAVYAGTGDVVEGNIIGNFPMAGILVRNNGDKTAPGPTVRNNTISNCYIGIEAGQIDEATITSNTIQQCRSGVVVADELLGASYLYLRPYAANPLNAATTNITVSNNQFVNITGPQIALTEKVVDMVAGNYTPNTFTLLQETGPNRYQPTPNLTTASRNPDGSIGVTGATVGAGTLEFYSNGQFLNSANVPGGSFTTTIPSANAMGVTTVSATVTVNRQTSEFSPVLMVQAMQGDTQPPTVTVTAPVAGQQIESKAGTQVVIAWQSSDNVGVVRHDIRLARIITNGTPTLELIATGLAGNVQNFTWNVPENLDIPQAMVNVEAADAAGNKGNGNSGVFTIKKPNTPPPDTEKPVVSGVTLSTKKVKRKIDPTLTITWKSTDNVGVTSHDLLFADTTPVVSGLPGNAQTFTWTVPASIPKKTTGTVKVIARDAAGNSGEAVSPLTITIK